MNYVIGSGPTGISAAMALLARGQRVTMLDVGTKLEIDRQQTIDRLATQPESEWATSDLDHIKENMEPGAAGIPLKFSYGSDYPYRGASEHLTLASFDVGLLPSFARGGFSNVWGSSILPYLPEDIDQWPIGIPELEPHYRAVLKFMPLAGQEDDMSKRFPLYTDQVSNIPESNQISRLFAAMNGNKQVLNDQGILFGKSRLAVKAANQHGFGCAACGLCMYGCPYGLIYSSAETLDSLRGNPLFTYIGDTIVESLDEVGGIVNIMVQNAKSGERRVCQGSRVYVGCGVIPTTRIILNSMKAYGKPLLIKDSQYFLLPWLRYWGSPDVRNEAIHTLSQAFVEVFDPAVSQKSIHLQIYTYNDLFRGAIKSSLGAAYHAFRPFEGPFLGRFLLIQGYLNSELSGNMTIRLDPRTSESPGPMTITSNINPETIQVVDRLVAKLKKNKRLFKAIPIRPLLKMGEPGRGFHSGGSLPMSRYPTQFETDILGRPHGFKRVHVVDASNFPSIPASTITFTAMANAHRIASTILADQFVAG